MNDQKIYSYPPVADEHCRVLILGTMPSVQSLRDGFYYAHPRNAFWKIIAECTGEVRPETIEEKKALLLRRHIALWDTAGSCRREGSLDSAMRDVELNDLGSFFKRYPQIEKVLLNGGTAWTLYHRLPEEIVQARPCVKLPSTSPAYTLSYEKKLAAWKAELEAGGIRP
jgi:hypoxanthine-DNA glycosylase